MTARPAWLAACVLCGVLVWASPLPAQPTVRAGLLENRAYAGALITGIHEAKRRIICAFYLFRVTEKRGNLPAAIATELVRARQRGVDVTVILEGGKTVWESNRHAASVLLRGGVRVVFPGRRAVTHAKLVAIDDRLVFVGSHNLTQSALVHNNEVSAVLDSPELALETRRYLEALR